MLRPGLVWPARSRRNGQQAGAAAGVVERTVVNRVARNRLADAQVVPVRRVDDVLLRPGGAGQHGHHVLRGFAGDGVADGGADIQPQRPAFEAFFIGGGVGLIVALAGGGKQLFGRVQRHPAFEGYFARAVVGRLGVQLGAAVAALHHRPGVRGGLGVVDDEQTGGAVAGGLLVLVAPAAVVRHRLALEHGGVVARVAGVVDEHHHGLALHVEAGVVVPLVLGGRHAVAGKHQRRVFDVNHRLLLLGEEHEVVAVLQLHRCAVARHRGNRVGPARDFHQRHRLEIAAIRARPQAQLLKFGG